MFRTLYSHPEAIPLTLEDKNNDNVSNITPITTIFRKLECVFKNTYGVCNHISKQQYANRSEQGTK